MNPAYVIRKYNGEGVNDWAVFRTSDLPEGHQGTVLYDEAKPVVACCSKTQAARYKKTCEEYVPSN